MNLGSASGVLFWWAVSVPVLLWLGGRWEQRKQRRRDVRLRDARAQWVNRR